MNNSFEIRGRETAIHLKTSDGKTIETLISTDDLEKVKDFIGTWYPSWNEGTQSYYVTGYGGYVNGKKKKVSLHRWIMDDPESYEVDHIFHDTLDNRYGNLRIVSPSVNNLNRKKSCGVYKSDDGIRWFGKIKFEGEVVRLGPFPSKKKAQSCVDAKREEMISKYSFQDGLAYEEDWFNKQVRGIHNREIASWDFYTQMKMHEERGDFSLTEEEWLETVEYFNFQCAYCGEENDDLTFDHFYPFSKGGEFAKGNIIPSCSSCNSSKQAELFDAWYPKQPFFDQRKEIEILKHVYDY